MKAIMISIKPEWVEKILNGEKTIEIRKTMPKCDLPCKVYIYCTKDKNNLLFGSPYFNGSWKVWEDRKLIKDIALVKGWDAKTGAVYNCDLANGKVVAEFTLNKIIKHEKNYIDVEDRLCYNFLSEDVKNAGFVNSEMDDWEKLDAFMDFDSFVSNYGNGKPLYAWHIDDLKIYNKPKELMQFLGFINCSNCNSYKYKPQNERFNMCNRCKEFRAITRPPQSWCYVEEAKDERN